MLINTNEEEVAGVERVIATVRRLVVDEDLVPGAVVECGSLAELRVVCEAEAAALPADPRTGRFTSAADGRLWRALYCGGKKAGYLADRLELLRGWTFRSGGVEARPAVTGPGLHSSVSLMVFAWFGSALTSMSGGGYLVS